MKPRIEDYENESEKKILRDNKKQVVIVEGNNFNILKNMSLAKIEFAVNMTCQKCVNTVRESLLDLNGIENLDISLERGTVVVETNLPFTLIQEKIEKSGKKAVLKGYGEGCIVDGTVDGLEPGQHGIHIHECGDISKGCESVGEHFNPYNSIHGGPEDDISKKHIGDLGNIEADNNGRALFRKINQFLTVSDIIGRSLVITDKPDDLGKGNDKQSKIDGNSGKRLACGIIARSSSLFQNTKKICACDGLTIWDERESTHSNQKELTKYTETSNKICIIC
ncbi:copper chaperone for superoxide dismutase isoform X4 [Vespula pensylvanica]|uniref:copper chaperone for superoxide dismutase isoform X4 n=1 Tax=Vespula pensylvanica TaxID=30213 RepID=UPI001CBA0E03|nr:copper chaperone for superoxide dismutase isoform X4 [Vespula pensylvanica]